MATLGECPQCDRGGKRLHFHGVPDAERGAQRRADLNTIFWANGGYRFLLGGTGLAETMENLAEVVQNRFALLREH
jgi:hypothetical protein